MNLIGRKHASICGMRHVPQLVLSMVCSQCGSRTSFKVIHNFVVDRQLESRLIMLDEFMSMFLLSLEMYSLLLREKC